MKEKLITTVWLPEFEHLSTVKKIVISGYRKTSNKFWVTFQGSKGYLSNITIDCEGIQQKPDNRIFVELFREKNGGFKNVMVKIYHSQDKGVRVAIEENETMKIVEENFPNTRQMGSVKNEFGEVVFTEDDLPY